MAKSIGDPFIIFTDLDGTLLDFYTYSFTEALPALNKLKECGAPLVINSSKARAEIEAMPDLISLSGIFIVENGSAIFMDKRFPLPSGFQAEERGPYRVILLGRPYTDVLGALHQARIQCRARLKGFSDMTIEEIYQITGLDAESSVLAKEREFSEPFVFEGDETELDCLVALLLEMGISCIQGGRLSYALGLTNKARAAVMVREIYRTAFPDTRWKTVALGDGPNDAAMLRTADIAIIIRRPDGTFLDYDPTPNQQVIISSKPGPEGWNDEVSSLLEESCPGDFP